MLFERFICQGAQRAARHRRRLRAPAARGSDPVRLRANTAATARRSPRRSSPTGRRARCATSARRSASTSRRSTASPASSPGGTAARSHAERIREAGFDPDNPVIRRGLSRSPSELIGFPRHLSQHVGGFVIARDLARAHGAGRERGDGRPHRHPVGQGRPRRARPAQGRLPRARHAVGDPPLRSTWCRASAARALAMQDIPAEDPGGLRDDASAPTPSACSRSSRARRSRCCRG